MQRPKKGVPPMPPMLHLLHLLPTRLTLHVAVLPSQTSLYQRHVGFQTRQPGTYLLLLDRHPQRHPRPLPLRLLPPVLLRQLRSMLVQALLLLLIPPPLPQFLRYASEHSSQAL